MPLYEFECTSCGNVLEKLMKISEPNPVHCEQCQGGPLKKVISRTHFVLKGQGWYETDFKNKRYDNAKPKKKAGDPIDCGTVVDANVNDPLPAAAETSA